MASSFNIPRPVLLDSGPIKICDTVHFFPQFRKIEPKSPLKYKRVLVVRGANEDEDDVDVDVDNNDDDRPTVVNASTKEVNANATDNTPTMIEIDCFILLISFL